MAKLFKPRTWTLYNSQTRETFEVTFDCVGNGMIYASDDAGWAWSKPKSEQAHVWTCGLNNRHATEYEYYKGQEAA